MFMKTCTKCKIPKDYSEFHPQATGRDGYRANCKECDRKRAKGYARSSTEEQKQKDRDARKKWYNNNREKAISRAKERYQKTKGKVRAYKKHDFKSEEERRAYLSKEHREYLRNHPEMARKLNKQMRERHGEEINAKLSLSRTLGIPYKDIKKFPELVELKKVQLAGMKEASLQLNPNNKNYNKKQNES